MRFYRALLFLYPASFRGEYGEELCAIQAQRLRDASSPLLLWIATGIEVLYNAARAHFDILNQDLRYCARSLARSPGFTATAVLVAALGIGATAAAFTMIDHVLIRPLPFAGQDRIVKLFESNSFVGFTQNDVAPANYRDWKRMATSFESMGAYRTLAVNLVGPGEPEYVDGASLTAEILPLLGVKPLLGRFFSPEDDRETSPGTAILSYEMWQKDFGGDPAILGRKIVLDDAAYTVIGVMPGTFYFPARQAKLWTAMRFEPAAFEDRNNTYIYGIAKLKRGVSLGAASAEMQTIAASLQKAFPKELAHIGVTLLPLHDDMPNQTRTMLKVLVAASLCVLLVACTNLANLLLTRALARRKELAVRAALGAGRERLVRQMLTESLALAGAGGILGIALANLSLPLLVRLVPVYLPIAEIPSMDWRIVLFSAAVTFATGIGFGVIPALRVSRNADAIREGSRSGVGGRKERLREALVVAEVAGSVALLASCGLLVRALWRIQAVDPGFRAANTLTMRTSLPMPKYQSNQRREEFYQRVLSRARDLPGVSGAAYTSFLPLVLGGGIWPVEVEGRPQPVPERQSASLRFVTPGYFQAMGIPLLRGRDVAESDKLDTEFVAVVSQSLVRRYWPNEDPMGRHFDFGNHARTVVGVVGDVRVRGLERASDPQVYLPYKQHRSVSTWYAPKDLVVRAGTGSVFALAPALRRIVHEADPEQPVSDVRMLEDIVGGQTATRRVQLGALGAFAAIAFLLAAIGIHGVLSFAVSTRTQELAVRIVLGAARADIIGMIVRDAVLLGAAGAISGAALAFGAGHAMRSLLAGVEPGDSAAFASAIGLCFGMTVAASFMPAARAVRIDSAKAIRGE